MYLWLGSPGQGDQPYRARLKSWAADLEFLPPQELAAVLRQVVAKRPQDVQGLTYLGKAEMSAGDPAAAARTFGRARRLEPKNLEVVALEAQALLTESEDKVTPEADAALKRVLALSPQDPMARYYLAKAQMDAGRTEEGLKGWRALADELPPGDERRLQLEQQIAEATGKASMAETVAKADAPAQQAFIKAMVSRLAGRLKEKPDDPEGWARLVRAYGVLGDKQEQERALASARKIYAQRPAVMLEIEKEAASPPQ
jgi:cytochrome c-type biogenesis protein CcmH